MVCFVGVNTAKTRALFWSAMATSWVTGQWPVGIAIFMGLALGGITFTTGSESDTAVFLCPFCTRQVQGMWTESNLCSGNLNGDWPFQ